MVENLNLQNWSTEWVICVSWLAKCIRPNAPVWEVMIKAFLRAKQGLFAKNRPKI